MSEDQAAAAGQAARNLDPDPETGEGDHRQRDDAGDGSGRPGRSHAELVQPKCHDRGNTQQAAATAVHVDVLSHPLDEFFE
ncbi:hypothetical protein [Blastococcus xanthinilyticus]|uniref:hypothetical protein n=1 Tax=Blastococcus xanthinilyticus TaxID=1564164 RepID=UPI0014128552|nr:hypothetical protein [Blastococcus xanthinilyticus]